MGSLILSKSHIDLKPYYVSEFGIHLYSAEELCYYIYNNVMLINDSFIDDRLLEFIEQSGYKETSEKIRKWRIDTSLLELLLVILSDIHYYNSAELNRFKDEAIRISKEGYGGIFKEKADYLVNIDRVYDAIKIYEKVLRSGESIAPDKLSGIYHGLGVAYTRLFDYEKAYVYYMKAYEISKNKMYLKDVYTLAGISDKVTLPMQVLKKAFPNTLVEVTKKWDAEISKKLKGIATDGDLLKIQSFKELDDREKSYSFLRLIDDWKADYKRCQN